MIQNHLKMIKSMFDHIKINSLVIGTNINDIDIFELKNNYFVKTKKINVLHILI